MQQASQLGLIDERRSFSAPHADDRALPALRETLLRVTRLEKMNLNKSWYLLPILKRFDVDEVTKDALLSPPFHTGFFPCFSFGHFMRS